MPPSERGAETRTKQRGGAGPQLRHLERVVPEHNTDGGAVPQHGKVDGYRTRALTVKIRVIEVREEALG